MSEPAPAIIYFAEFSLDIANARLRRGAEVLPLRPKTLAVLSKLAGCPGQLLTKDELLDAAWGDTAVTPSVLTGSVKELRRVLNDDPRSPRIIETAHRHGYRFIAPVRLSAAADQPPTSGTELSPPSAIIGRENELRNLSEWLGRARGGERQTVFVIGEPGIGKTALVEEFIRGLDDERRLAVTRLAVKGSEDDPLSPNRLTANPLTPYLVARGQCIAQHGAGEPYLPVLEAFARLCNGPDSEMLIALLRRHAPAWLVQLPGLLEPAEAEALEIRIGTTTRERVLREMAALVVALPAPLVLILEDLHWSDYATLDLVSMLAQRSDPARLLLIGTYRPVEVAIHSHPLKSIHQALRAHGQCRELWLPTLNAEMVTAYLAARWPGIERVDELERMMSERSDGNPLFLVNLADYLVERGIVVDSGGRWQLHGDLSAAGVPEELRELIAAHLEQLGEPDREVLEAASVIGRTFSADLVAAVLGADVVAVEKGLATLADRRQMVREAASSPRRDQVSGRYGFSHFLYQSGLKECVPPARLRQLHARIALALERSYGERANEFGPELAYHFEASAQTDRAVAFLEEGAARALRRGATHEAAALLEHGLNLLDGLPSTAERTLATIRLCISLGSALSPTSGFADPRVERAYVRARDLSAEIDSPGQLFQALVALACHYVVRARIPQAQETAQRLDALMNEMPLPAFLFAGNMVIGMATYHGGALVEARRRLESALAVGEVPLPSLVMDLRLVTLTHLAITLVHQGFPDQALATNRSATARAKASGRPSDSATVLQNSCVVSLLLRDLVALAPFAEEAVRLGSEHAFPMITAVGLLSQGWIRSANGDPCGGVALMQEAIAVHRERGQMVMMPLMLATLAEGQTAAGQLEAALATIAAARDTTASTGEIRFAAELHRLEGEVHSSNHEWSRAEACFLNAIEAAQGQGARWWELRATTSWVRLQQQSGTSSAGRRIAREALASTVASCLEGEQTVDLQAARRLLSELS